MIDPVTQDICAREAQVYCLWWNRLWACRFANERHRQGFVPSAERVKMSAQFAPHNAGENYSEPTKLDRFWLEVSASIACLRRARGNESLAISRGMPVACGEAARSGPCFQLEEGL
jgi:hypothetical protein